VTGVFEIVSEWWEDFWVELSIL